MSNDRPRVFVDSSVIIAASISSRGYARDLILSGIRGEIDLVCGQLVLDETERNLARKAPVAVQAFNRFKSTLNIAVVEASNELVE